jgi:hypothetical protein
MNLVKYGILRLEQLITTSVFLKLSGIAYLLLSCLFILVMYIWDFQIIDEMYTKDVILAHIGAMSETQKHVHAVMTATLDVVYPFTYGFFQAGMALRYFGSWGKWIALLSLVCIPFDLVEGFSQVMLLTGSLQYVELKAVVTPIKLALYLPGLAFALIAVIVALKLSKRKTVK